MTATYPARPGTGLTAAQMTGTKISDNATGGAVFYIKTTSATFNASMPVVETTGSGDTSVMYSHGDKPYYDIQLQGVMLATKAVGLSNLTQQIGTDGVPDVTLDFKFSGDSSHAFTNMPVIVTQCQIQYDPKLPVVGVALALKSMSKTNKGLDGDFSS